MHPFTRGARFWLLVGALMHTSAAGQLPLRIGRVSWLEGCWESRSGSRIVEERWMAPRAGTMLGMGRTAQGEQLIEYELVLIREQDGRLGYEAHPAGQPAGVFLSTVIGERQATFENLQHDFPQRVGYRRKGKTLLAWIEGERNGRIRRVDFTYQRVACGPR